MKKFFKKTEGFTLVELIVVIAILGILAGVGTVGYSGYIKKAQNAADNQLLAAVNQAYAAACIENGVDSKQVAAKSITIGSDKTVDKSDIVVTNPTAKAADIQAAFEKYFSGNEGSEFKVFATLTYDKKAGGFKHSVLSDAYAALLDTFSDDVVDAVKNSTFGEMGASSLLGSVDIATAVASGILADESDPYRDEVEQIIYSEETEEVIVNLVGEDGFDAILEQKMEQLRAAGYEESELEDMAMEAIFTNATVFNVATNGDFDPDTFKTYLANGSAKAIIKTNLQEGGDVQAAMSQAAMTYAMYTAYASQNNITLDSDTAFTEVLGALNDQDFIDWMGSEQAETDVTGYKAAMDMISSSSGSSDVAADLLLNGFNNEQLMLLIQSTVG